MKKMLMLLVAVLLSAVPVFGEKLVCDVPLYPIAYCEVQVIKSNVSNTYPGICAVSNDGSCFELLDVSGFSNGAYTFRVRWAGDLAWWGAWYEFSAVKPGGMNNMRIK